MTRYIFITGGVVSSLGKGISSASLGAILEARGLNVTLLKLDPYINVDPGTMSPFQHGEVYVTNDGAETDLDLGHYERFVRTTMGKRNNYTTVDNTRTAAEARALIEQHQLVARVQLFDVYEGEGIPEGKKSLAFSVTYQSPDHTLTDKDVADAQRLIVRRLGRELDAELRGEAAPKA